MQVSKQTLRDLEIFEGKNGCRSIFDILDRTETKGGRYKLKEMFENPKSDIFKINSIQECLKYISNNPEKWRNIFSHYQIRELLGYLESMIRPVREKSKIKFFLKCLEFKAFYPRYYETLREGTHDVIQFLFSVKKFYQERKEEDLPIVLKKILLKIEHILGYKFVKRLISNEMIPFLKFKEIFIYDYIFRISVKKRIIELIDFFHEIDAFNSMIKAIDEFNLSMPVFRESSIVELNIKGHFHLQLDNPIKNDLSIEEGKNLIFLTGPNMAGKSVYLRSCAIALYLAHIGMGVPADKMELTPFSGILSSINTEENIRKGYSYFYSEVKNIKDIAAKLTPDSKNFIILDEPFKGTNIKDSYEITKLVISGFIKWPKNLFILGTHLIELEKDIKRYPQIMFRRFEAIINNGKPIYEYKLKKGVSSQRLGFTIIMNENIPQYLDKGSGIE